MVQLAAGGTFLISPGAGLLLYTGILLVLLLCGLVTASKGRWGWLVVGFLTAGIGWVIGALQNPQPNSIWARLSAARQA